MEEEEEGNGQEDGDRAPLSEEEMTLTFKDNGLTRLNFKMTKGKSKCGEWRSCPVLITTTITLYQRDPPSCMDVLL